MQTFLPYPDAKKTARCLDKVRLGKQRVEALQILQALTKHSGWVNHPMVKMWRGYESALVQYGQHICNTWTALGYQDTCCGKMQSLVNSHAGAISTLDSPPWMGNEAFHDSHKAALLWKGACDALWTLYRKGLLSCYAHKGDVPHHLWRSLVADMDPSLNHYAQFGWAVKMAVPDDKGSIPYVWFS